jgi:hypothetical protein
MKTIIKTVIALMLISSLAGSAMANHTGKRHNKRTAASELYFLTHGAIENHLALESWMNDIDYFSTETVAGLEEWMSDPLYFYPVYLLEDHEKSIGIETWMSDPLYFYQVHPINHNDGWTGIEAWMSNPGYFCQN